MKGRRRVVEYSRSWRRCKGKEGEEVQKEGRTEKGRRRYRRREELKWQ